MQPPDPHVPATLAFFITHSAEAFGTMDDLQQSLQCVKLLSLCGNYYLTRFLFKHLQGFAWKAQCGSWKPLTSSQRRPCIRGFILNTSLRIRPSVWQAKKVDPHDSWLSGPLILQKDTLRSTLWAPRWIRSPSRCLPIKVLLILLPRGLQASTPFLSLDFCSQDPTKPHHWINTAVCVKYEPQKIQYLAAFEENKHSTSRSLDTLHSIALWSDQWITLCTFWNWGGRLQPGHMGV